MKYTTVFLDFDDTLIDTQGFASKCLKEIYDHHNINVYYPTCDEFLKVYHKHTHGLWEAYALGQIDKETLLRERFYKPFEHLPQVTDAYKDNMNQDFMRRVVKIDSPIEGAKELMEYLKPKYKIVMLSNGFSEMQYKKMENAGLAQYFDEVILSDVVGVNKPHPDIFTYALQQSGSTAASTIMIGDSFLADIEGAMKSNIDQIWYNPRNEKADVEPTYMVHHLAEITNII